MQRERTYKRHTYQKGAIYGRLTLTGKNYLKILYGQQRRIVEAECICGVMKWYIFSRLAQADTRSCGCLRVDTTRELFTTHGLTEHPLYDVYKEMLNRCFVPHHKQYKDYGGRGISVCEEWQEDFVTFYVWSIEAGWGAGYSLDRIKNDKGYGPINCRFVKQRDQNRNTRRNIQITAFGETKVLFDWGEDPRCVLTAWGLRTRYKSGKWTDMEAMITTPLIDKKVSQNNMITSRMLTAFGETKSLTTWTRDSRCVVKLDGLRDRIDRGWSVEDALTKVPDGILAWGETKNMSQWIKDERCLVKIDALRERLNAGWPAEDAISTSPQRRNKKRVIPSAP